MARPLRIHYENACYHVTCRGNGRQAIFLSDGDRKRFLDLLARSLEIYQVDLLAFVLMDNHFHLIVRTPKANLKEFMRHFNISYTASFNKGHGRSGHLYQGRYKAFLIDADSYLLAVSRYVHCNPVHTNELTGSWGQIFTFGMRFGLPPTTPRRTGANSGLSAGRSLR